MGGYYVIGYKVYDNFTGGRDPILVGPFNDAREAHHWCFNHGHKVEFEQFSPKEIVEAIDPKTIKGD
jgi:hypothetical protein